LTRTTLVEIVTTVSSESEAVEIVGALVRDGLAACGSIVPCRSIYRWKGAVEDGREYEIRLKTLSERADDAETRLVGIHPYETPQVLRFPVDSASEDYAAWVAECVRRRPGERGGAP
jgi:periplasmic divalent cation tolerance protein